MKIKLKTIIVFFIFFTISSKAQEFNIKINGGNSGILYKSQLGDGNLKTGSSFGLGLGYTYFLNNHWGIITGLEGQYSQNSFNLNEGTTLNSNEIDDQTSAFEYRVSSKNYKENQQFLSVVIPLLFQYRTDFSNNTGLYFALGAKALFPGKMKVKASADEVAVSGYYPDNNLVIDDLPSHGFGKVSNWQAETTKSLSPSILLSVEGGLKFKLNNNLNLYTGIYFDYGLTDLAKENQYDNVVNYSPNGIDMIQANGVIENRNVVQKSNFLSTGIDIKLGFSISKKKTHHIEETNEILNTEPTQKVVVEKPKEIIVSKELPTEDYKFTQQELIIIKKPLGFDKVGSTDLSPELVNRLDEMSLILKKDKNLLLNITGYTCNIGTEEQNLKIGMLRAESVANYLKNKGIEANRMNLESKGEKDYLVPNTSEENRIKNRRVSLLVIDKQ